MPSAGDPRSVPRVLPVLALLAASAVAGCAVAPQEVACDDRIYVSIHYDRVLNGTRLLEAFEAAGYATRPGPVNDTTRLLPPDRAGGDDAYGLVSVTPGPSGPGTLVSFEGEEPGLLGGNPAVDAARDAARVVNATFADDPPTVARWIVEGPNERC